MNKETLIDHLKEDLKNELHHMHFYLWASSVVTGLHRAEYSEFFADAAKSEMNHVREFSHAMLSLGAEIPTPTAKMFAVPTDIANLLNYAISIENQVVVNYFQRIQQAAELGGADGKYLEIFLENQLLDSRNDATEMTQMIKDVV